MGSFSPKIETPKIAEDPSFAANQAQAQRTLIDSLQTQAQLDTASIMARFGTKLALSGAGMAAPGPSVAG